MLFTPYFGGCKYTNYFLFINKFLKNPWISMQLGVRHLLITSLIDLIKARDDIRWRDVSPNLITQSPWRQLPSESDELCGVPGHSVDCPWHQVAEFGRKRTITLSSEALVIPVLHKNGYYWSTGHKIAVKARKIETGAPSLNTFRAHRSPVMCG